MKEELSDKEVALIQAICFYMLDVEGFTKDAEETLHRLHKRFVCDSRTESLVVWQ